MKLKHILTALTLIAFTSASLAKSCFPEGDSLLICQYSGETGLELMENPKLHQIQRLPVYLGDSLGSIALVRNALVEGLEYKECWSTASRTQDLMLYCSQRLSPSGEIPAPILNEIDRLRAN